MNPPLTSGDRPIAVDARGNGLYERPDGSRAFVDVECCEDRWIRDQCERLEIEAENREAEEELDRARTSERDRWAEEDDEWPWRRREKPRGLMYGVAAPQETECAS